MADHNAPAVESEIVDDATSLTVLDGSMAIEAMSRGETDIQISTAKRYPRDLAKVLKSAETMATMDEETAASMMYAVPRAGKTVRGPSVRLAEVMTSCWGNLRTSTMVSEIGKEFITVRGMCWDLETNVASGMEVKRRITDRRNNRFNNDMIQTTCNAASAIAYREAVLKVIPRAYSNKIYGKARSVAMGDSQTLGERVDAMLGHFHKMGVSTAQVLIAAEKDSVELIDLETLLDLRGIATAIKDGETTIDAAFPPVGGGTVTAAPSKRTDEVNAALKQGNPAAQQPASSAGAAAATSEVKTEQKPEAAGGPFGDLSNVQMFLLKLAEFAPAGTAAAQIRSAVAAAAKNIKGGKTKPEDTTAEWRTSLVEAARDKRFDWKLGVIGS